jgi:hypothetical protein
MKRGRVPLHVTAQERYKDRCCFEDGPTHSHSSFGASTSPSTVVRLIRYLD